MRRPECLLYTVLGTQRLGKAKFDVCTLLFNSHEANQMGAPYCYTCCAPPSPALSRLSVTRNKMIKQLIKPCSFSFLHVRGHFTNIFNLLIIALVSNRQVKEARSCVGAWYPNWTVFGKTFCREKCDSDGNKLML